MLRVIYTMIAGRRPGRGTTGTVVRERVWRRHKTFKLFVISLPSFLAVTFKAITKLFEPT